MKKILITGVAGFIGFHVAERMLALGYHVAGIDSLSDYYDVRIKNKRLSILKKYPQFMFRKISIANYKKFKLFCKKEQPDEIIHLAAQAGVRYSITNPWAYADANYLGTLNVFECAKALKLSRVIYASSSSVYGAHSATPFLEDDKTDTPLSIYAASKKANEVLAYSYYSLYGMEMIGLRFFTVYGRWGRPDMALFKFVRSILNKTPIALYNKGKMKRSFTHISDAVWMIEKIVAKKVKKRNTVYNIGGAEAVSLIDFINLIEGELGMTTRHNLLPMQAGDIAETVASCSKAYLDYKYVPKTDMKEGIRDFVRWFKENKTFLLSLKTPLQ